MKSRWNVNVQTIHRILCILHFFSRSTKRLCLFLIVIQQFWTFNYNHRQPEPSVWASNHLKLILSVILITCFIKSAAVNPGLHLFFLMIQNVKIDPQCHTDLPGGITSPKLNQSHLLRRFLLKEIKLNFESELFKYEWYYINNNPKD